MEPPINTMAIPITIRTVMVMCSLQFLSTSTHDTVMHDNPMETKIREQTVVGHHSVPENKLNPAKRGAASSEKSHHSIS